MPVIAPLILKVARAEERAAGVSRVARMRSIAQRNAFPPAVTIFAPLAAALLLWVVALPAVDLAAMTDLGLVSVLPPAYFVALVVLIVGFCLTLRTDLKPSWAPAAYIAAWIAMLHATPSLLYGSLRYAWAWKHVGIVDYIQRAGRIDPTIDVLSVYHNWPGFFGVATLITEVTGFGDALLLASWAPFTFELLFAVAVSLILRTASSDRRLVWFGVWVFSLTNWVGQDYFAPQAMAYFFYLVVIGVCLWALPERTPLTRTLLGRALRPWARPSRILAQLDERAMKGHGAGTLLPAVTERQRRGLLALTLVLLAVIASSHQLTPMLSVLALFTLVLFRQCRAYGLPLLMAVFTAAWLVTGASGYAAVGIREIADSLGRTGANFSANLIDPSTFSPGVRIVSTIARVLTGSMGVLALLGWIRRLRHGYLDVPLTLLWLTPLTLLAVSSYGGEILFRIYFYALPFMAFFVAALIFPTPGKTLSFRQQVTTVVLSVALAVGFLFAYYGHERMNYFSPAEVSAIEVLDRLSPDGALLIEASPNYPSRYHRYEQYEYVPLITWTQGNALDTASPYTVEDIKEMMSDRTFPAAYLVFTRGQLAALNIPALASITKIQREVETSGAFTVLYANDATSIYALTERLEEGEP